MCVRETERNRDRDRERERERAREREREKAHFLSIHSSAVSFHFIDLIIAHCPMTDIILSYYFHSYISFYYTTSTLTCHSIILLPLLHVILLFSFHSYTSLTSDTALRTSALSLTDTPPHFLITDVS